MKARSIVSLLAGALTMATLTTHAQKKNLTLDDAVLGLRGGAIMPENLKQLQWKQTTLHYTQVVGADKALAIIQQHPQLKQTDTLITLQQLNKILFQKDSLSSIPAYVWDQQDRLLLKYKNKNYFLSSTAPKNWTLDLVLTTPENASNITWDSYNRQFAYTIDNDLFLVDAYNKPVTIAKSNAPHVVYGQSVHRNEFGISGGIFFSPKNNHIAFYKMDESMVADYPIINWQVEPAVNTSIKYPMAGKASHHVSIGVYNIIKQQTIYLDIEGPKDQYLTNISWSPNEQYIFVGVLNRKQNHLKWNQYSATTGKFIKTLFEEKNDKYVEPQHPLFFTSDQEFVWMSQRSGYMHLYKYNTSGKLLKQLTSGAWLVNGILGIDKSQNTLIIAANKEDAREKHLYSLNFSNGKLKNLNTIPGIHQGLVHSSGKYIINSYQNATTPRVIQVVQTHTGQKKVLLTATDKLAAYQTAQVETVTLETGDGTPLYGKLILPNNFNPQKKYPVIVYLYNGPHLQLITNSYPASGNLWYDYMTQEGFIVFTMDGRGSSNRGFNFESATFRQLGQVEMHDQLKGVEYLKSLPYIDQNRMGVHGWSYGGFMTTSLMTEFPNVFKVGVAGGPVIDWNLYEIMYTERYMDSPEENPEGYKYTELSSKVDKVTGKLLMIHGTDDDVVVWQHSIKYIEASVKKGKQIDYFAYPGHKHNVLGKDRVHLMRKVSDYFIQHLK